MKERKTLVLNEFRGVDFSTSPLRVKATRASDMVNFYIDAGGRTRKRPGWQELLCIRDADGVPLPINGIFDYTYGGVHHTIVHAGCRFFRLGEDENVLTSRTGRAAVEDITESGTYAPSCVEADRLTSTRSQVFYCAGRMYIIGCGDYLVYGTWNGGESFELRRVWEDEDTYVPHTTVNIGGTEEDTRETLESVNSLTRRRINGLVGLPDGQDYGFYQLDASVDEDGMFEIRNTVTGEVFTRGSKLWTGPYEVGGHTIDGDFYDIECYSIPGYSTASVGYVCLQTGQLYLHRLKEWIWPTDTTGTSVIEVLFTHTPTAEEAGVDEADFVPYDERVGRCSFGVMYGVNGNTDQLFLAGNPAFANVDFYSWVDDLTYFPDNFNIATGSPEHAVVGYARLADNTLALFKQTAAGAQASIFYRTGYAENTNDDNGVFRSIKIKFPTSAGNLGEVMLSRYASLDFGGDNLMLSYRGVFGIELTSNVATAERYTRERSRNVNARLTQEPHLSEAVAIAHDGRYYLAVNGHCYVADARYRFYSDRASDDSYNYEWWFWDNVPARVFAQINGRLAFGTVDGRICIFDDRHSDRTYTMLEEGDIAIDAENAQIDFNEEIRIGVGDCIVIDTPGLYALFGEGYTVKNGRIFTDEERILRMSDGVCVYADGDGLDVGVAYTVDDVDVGDCSFRLLDAGGKVAVPSGDGFRLHLPISERELYVAEVADGDIRVALYRGGAALTLTAYDGDVPSLPTGRLIHARAVEARWVTPVFDLGSAAHGKTLLSLSMTAEPGIGGQMTYGYETRREISEYELRGSRPFSFDSLSYRDFSFDTGFAKSDTRRVFDRGFNYIAFRFSSETDTDCAIGAFSAMYKFNGYQGGIR